MNHKLLIMIIIIIRKVLIIWKLVIKIIVIWSFKNKIKLTLKIIINQPFNMNYIFNKICSYKPIIIIFWIIIGIIIRLYLF